MKNTTWIMLDTETTGFRTPVFVVELAAQRMRGWEAEEWTKRALDNGNT
jgi:hypothetical protein